MLAPRFLAATILVTSLVSLPTVHAQTTSVSQTTVTPHAGMLRYPSVSATQIAFIYAGKLWLVSRSGGLAYPCASPPGNAAYSRFSPDGSTLAFSANYDGNTDLYTIPVEGGTPTRVTYHPGADILCNWTPEGKLLFTNNALGGINRFSILQTVPATGGLPTRLPVPYGEDAAISPDGRFLAYTPSSTNNRTWKRYRGGWAQDIWLMDLKDKSAKQITNWEGTDTFPMWQGDKIYYLSDGGSEHRLNIWVYDRVSGTRKQVTTFTDYDVKWPSIGPGAIVFQYGSELRLLDLKTEQSKPINIQVPGDRQNLRPRPVEASRLITDWSISPSAKRVALAARGDIWTAPAKDGTPRNLTRSSGVHEINPNWSPNGQWIAYLSDATGEYELYLAPSDGKGTPKRLTTGGNKYRYLRGWSPDSKSILFVDKTGSLFVCAADTGKVTTIDRDPEANPIGGNWSPDSRYIAYTKTLTARSMTTIWIYDTQTSEKRQVTSGVFNDQAPVFDRKGEYLFFVSNRSYNHPEYDDVQQSWIYSGTQVLVGIPLRTDIVSPFAPKSDEESPNAEPDKDDKKAENDPSNSTTSTETQKDDGISGEWSGNVTPGPRGDVSLKMTLTRMGSAISGTVTAEGFGTGTVSGTYDAPSKNITLTISVPGAPGITFSGNISGNTLTATGDAQGQALTLTATRSTPAMAKASPSKTPSGTSAKAVPAATKVTIDFEGIEARSFALPIKQGSLFGLSVNSQNQLLFMRGVPDESPSIKVLDLSDAKHEEKTVAANASGYDITPDGKKILVFTDGAGKIQDATAGAAAEPVPTSSMTAIINPKEEWREIFDEAWRIERDFFYDPNMHGVNWQGVHDAYAKMLADCNSRSDVSFVIGEMIAELNVGHTYYSGGDLPAVPSVSVGMLGVDFTLENGAYRIHKIYRGGAWDTDAIGPLSQPGVKAKEGDYLLAVNGIPLDTHSSPWAAFQGLADKTVTITVSAKPTIDKEARDIVVRLLGSEDTLRYRAWIEKNRAYVEKVTGGKVGYIYVPNTGQDGQGDLVRQFLGQMGKEALIIDERWNGGGQIPTRFIELLNRPVTNYWARRDSDDWPWPPDAHTGPKCMLINGLAGSGGDAFPWYFRQAGLGKLIGTRTWGGLVGISGTPPLIDGASVTAPDFAFYKKNSTWGIEGHGVDPDIEVLDDPSKMQNGADPQLDAAIRQMLDEIKTRPYIPPKRPVYPDKTKMGINKKDI